MAACGDTARPASPLPPPVPDAAGPGEGALRIVLADGVSVGSVVTRFAAATGCRVDLVSGGRGPDLVADAPFAGADVYAVPGEDLLALVSRGAAQPVTTAAIPGYPAVISPLRTGEVARRDAFVYGVPFVWGPDELLYEAADFAEPPVSWSVLYDPARSGQVAMRDSPMTLATAAVVLGADDPFGLSAEDLAAAAALSQRQRPAVRVYWRTPADLALLFANKQVQLAAGTGAQARSLAGSGVQGVVPDGVTTAWSDWWVLASSAPHPRCAYKWFAYTLSPAAQVDLAEAGGGSPASAAACALLGTVECAAGHDQDGTFLARMRFGRTPDAPTGLTDWQNAWARSR